MSSDFTTGPLVLEEMMKIVSLLENPEEAEYIRKALRFYQIPAHLKDSKAYKWGQNADIMHVMQHYDNPQNPWELDQMLEIVKGKTRVLEIGSSFGGTLRRMAAVMPRGSKLVSVDLDCDETWKFLNPLDSLKETCRRIGLMGGNVELFIADSHSQQTVDAVRSHGPYDFGFIDAGHTYRDMKLDWENYGPMCKIVGFHDIGGGLSECKTCWDEIKAEATTKGWRTQEFVQDTRQFGIGIVHRQTNGSAS